LTSDQSGAGDTPGVNPGENPDELLDDELDDSQLVLGDLLNHVLDKGVVISGNVTISIADIDLLVLDLRVLLTSVESSLRRGLDQSLRGLTSGSEEEQQ
jgi:gas vesicle structural protein